MAIPELEYGATAEAQFIRGLGGWSPRTLDHLTKLELLSAYRRGFLRRHWAFRPGEALPPYLKDTLLSIIDEQIKITVTASR